MAFCISPAIGSFNFSGNYVSIPFYFHVDLTAWVLLTIISHSWISLIPDRGQIGDGAVEDLFESTYASQGLAEACKFVYNDAKYVNERARNDIVLLSR